MPSGKSALRLLRHYRQLDKARLPRRVEHRVRRLPVIAGLRENVWSQGLMVHTFLRGEKEALWARYCTGAPARGEAVRRAIQHSQESLRALAQRYSVNQKTVAQVEEALLGGRSADRAEAGRIDCSFLWKKKPLSWPSAGTRCCRLTTACTPSRPPFRG